MQPARPRATRAKKLVYLREVFDFIEYGTGKNEGYTLVRDSGGFKRYVPSDETYSITAAEAANYQ
jgi:hypothetical protein